MLRTLTIRDFVIVDTIELEFSNGFSVFTGETGAGKSILIDALQLALGGRGDASMVREGAPRADISAEFALTPAASGWLEQNEFGIEDGGALLRRVIDNAGRSKAYINGSAATASQLRELGELLVDIHGQHAHQSLLKVDAQRALLDNQCAVRDAAAAAQVQAVSASLDSFWFSEDSCDRIGWSDSDKALSASCAPSIRLAACDKRLCSLLISAHSPGLTASLSSSPTCHSRRSRSSSTLRALVSNSSRWRASARQV
jgi:hypothetical protein